jgi:two-component system nitrogen regulation response regulator GlnG
MQVPTEGRMLPISVVRSVPEKADMARIHVLVQPSSYKLLRDFRWPGNFRQLEMMLSNLIALTLVELVDRAEEVEPDAAHQTRPDVVPILPRTVRDLLRPMEVPARSASADTEVVEEDDGTLRLRIDVKAADSLNAVSCAVEAQYLRRLYEKYSGDLGRMADVLLDDPDAGRKVQLRMNQLGIKLRKLKRQRPK